MEQKTAIGVLIAIIVVCGIIFVLYQQQESQPLEEEYEPDFGPVPGVEIDYAAPVPGSILDECGTQETQYKRDLCWRFEAYDEMNAEKCLNIEENSDRVICIRAIARDFQSEPVLEKEAVCDSYFTESSAKAFSCYEALLPEIRSEKLAICNQYFKDGEMQLYRCHAEVARELLDYSVCDAIPKQAYKDNCYFIIDFENPGTR